MKTEIITTTTGTTTFEPPRTFERNDNSLEPFDMDEYERDLKRRQDEHLRQVRQNIGKGFERQPCMHDSCPECVGTGIRKDGTPCIHMISCPCPKCTPR